MGFLMGAMSDTYYELGMDVTTLTEQFSPTSTAGMTNALSALTTIGLLVYLILINSFAGGEQKRRSIIIPQNSGLESYSYLVPKFIIYPLSIFAFTVISVIIAGVVSTWAFDNNDIIILNAFVGAALAGLYNMFFVCLHLALGTSTGRAGMSSAICIVSAFILSDTLNLAGIVPAFNPLTMNLTAVLVAAGDEIRSGIILGVGITLALMIAVFFIALFVQNAKRIDNSGNEIII
jgi:ABC-2 type transport system permease protein